MGAGNLCCTLGSFFVASDSSGSDVTWSGRCVSAKEVPTSGRHGQGAGSALAQLNTAPRYIPKAGSGVTGHLKCADRLRRSDHRHCIVFGVVNFHLAIARYQRKIRKESKSLTFDQERRWSRVPSGFREFARSGKTVTYAANLKACAGGQSLVVAMTAATRSG